MDDAFTSRPSEPEVRPYRSETSSLLLIQPDAEAALLREQLAADGLHRHLEIVQVPTFAEGLREVDGARFDVVLLDLDMPGTSDLDGLGKICRGSSCPVIALSSVEDDAHGLAAMHAGAHDYLVKGHLTPTAVRRVVSYAVERGRWRAEQAWRDRLQQHKLELLLSQFPGTLWTTDTESRFTQSVGGELDRLGVTTDEVVGQELGGYLGEPDGPAVRAHRRSLAGEMAEYDWEQGGRRWHAATAPLLDGDDEVVGVVGVATDVTEKHRARNAIVQALADQRAAAQELQDLNRMKDTFLQSVSHELRTPLTSIIGFAQVLQGMGSAIAEDQLDLFHGRLLANARRLEQLLDDLLDVDRLTQGRLEPIRIPTDLAGLITTVVESRQNPRLEVTTDLEPVTLAVEASRVERIVDNLVRNVSRHTPSGTSVWIRLRSTPAGAEIVVDDDGPGIPPEDRGRLLAPFEQGSFAATSAQPGTGIGLALVTTFARMHGGDVEIGESPAGGACVTVTLSGPPSSRAHPGAASVALESAQPASGEPDV